MSLITIVTVIPDQQKQNKNRPGTIPELMQVITDNCNLIVPTLRRSLENMKRRE
jgi:hypothetical protein